MSDTSRNFLDELDKFKKPDILPNKARARFADVVLRISSSIGGLFLNTKQRAELDYKRCIGNGNKLLNANDFYGAIDFYNEALKINTLSYYAYYKRGFAKSCMQDYLSAIPDFEFAIKFSPKAVIPTKSFNKVDRIKNPGIFKADEFGGGTQLLQPKLTASAYFRKGFANSMVENYQHAIEDYDHSLRLNDNNKEAYYNRGIAKHEIGDVKGARLDWERAYELGVIKANEMIENYC